MTTANVVLDIARSRLGLSEQPRGSNNVPGITDWYGMRGAWCAMYVSRTFWDAGMPLPASSPKGFAWVSAGFDWMRRQGWCTTDIRSAQPGDLLAFEWGQTAGGYDHIGICEEVRPDGLVTIEGNIGDRVQRLWRTFNGGGVVEIAKPPFDRPEEEDDDMASVLVTDPDDPTGRVWECWGVLRRHITTLEDLNVKVYLGTKYLDGSTDANFRRHCIRTTQPVDSFTCTCTPTGSAPVDVRAVAKETADEIHRRMRG